MVISKANEQNIQNKYNLIFLFACTRCDLVSHADASQSNVLLSSLISRCRLYNLQQQHREPSYPFRIRIKDQTTFIARVLWRPFWTFSTRARSASARSGTEILEVWDLQILRGSDRSPKIIIKWQAPSRLRVISISVPDLALVDRERFKNSKWPPQNAKHAR